MCVLLSVGVDESDSCRPDFRGSSCVRFSLKCIRAKLAGTLQEDDLGTVMGTDRTVQRINKQLTKRPALYKISTGSTSHHVQYKRGTTNVLSRFLH